jgi:D-lactate dehydrogenase
MNTLRLPLLPAGIPVPRVAAATPVAHANASGPKVVYFASCLSKIMGSGAAAVIETLSLCGYDVIPAAPQAACCGQAFASKGYEDAARIAAADLAAHLDAASDGGRIPIVSDTSPCTARLLTDPALKALEIYDFPSFMARKVLPTRADWPRLDRHLVLHPTCSNTKHDQTNDLIAVAKAFATDVEVPLAAGCCGFAGDKGFQVPELTRAATRREGEEVRALAGAARARGKDTYGYSTCQTCSYGMEAATGIAYESIAQLCADALRQFFPTNAFEIVDSKLFSN